MQQGNRHFNSALTIKHAFALILLYSLANSDHFLPDAHTHQHARATLQWPINYKEIKSKTLLMIKVYLD